MADGKIDIERLNQITLGDLKEKSPETPEYNDYKNTKDGNTTTNATVDAYNSANKEFQNLTVDLAASQNPRGKSESKQEISLYNSEAVKSGVQEGNSINNPKEGVEISPYTADAAKVEAERYENKVFGGGGESKDINFNLDNVDLRKKLSNDQKNNIYPDIFLRNIFPIMGTSLVKDFANLSNDDFTLTSALSTIQTIYNIIYQFKYLSPFEMILYLGSNFYTLHFVRGITAKKFTGFFGTAWNGYPDINFGQAYAKILPSINDLLEAIANAVEPEMEIPGFIVSGDNYQLQKAKELRSKKYIGLAPFSKDVSVKQNGTQSPGDTYAAIKSNDIILKQFDSTDSSWDEMEDESQVESHSYTYRDKGKRENKPANLTREKQSPYLVNDKVINILIPSEEGTDQPVKQDDANEGGLQDIKDYRPEEMGIGYIYVLPQSSSNKDFSNYKIPFEFNPEISKGGVSTSYNAQTVLSRIGALQTFSHVELSTVDISTEYLATTSSVDDFDASGSFGNNWMKYYSLENIQAIQRAYEALSFPDFPANEDQSKEKGFEYTKPPLVKVVIGNADSEDDVYSNLLTYPKNVKGEGDTILQSQSNKRLYKTFIVTSVNIEKNLEETPLYIRNKQLKDTFGFTVSISLAEVTKNYMDVMPNYENYFKQYKTAVKNNSGLSEDYLLS